MQETTEAIEKMTKEMPVITQQAEAFQVEGSGDMEEGQLMLSQIKVFVKNWKAEWAPIKKSADQLHKDIVKREKLRLDILGHAKDIITNKMMAWRDAQEALAEAAAKKEALRLQKAHEAALRRAEAATRKLTENASSLDEAVKAIDDRLANPDLVPLEISALEAEKEVLLAKIEKAAQKIEEKREAIEEMPETYGPVIPVSVPKTKGVSYRTSYKVEVIDRLKLIKAIASKDLPTSLVKFDTVALGRLAKMNIQLPGTKVTKGKTLISR